MRIFNLEKNYVRALPLSLIIIGSVSKTLKITGRFYCLENYYHHASKKLKDVLKDEKKSKRIQLNRS